MHFQGQVVVSAAPKNNFVGAGRRVTQSYKWILRGRWGSPTPLNVFSGVCNGATHPSKLFSHLSKYLNLQFCSIKVDHHVRTIITSSSLSGMHNLILRCLTSLKVYQPYRVVVTLMVFAGFMCKLSCQHIPSIQGDLSLNFKID